MIRASAKAGRKLMIAYRAQYEPFNLEVMRLAHSGELGELKLVVSDHGRNLDPSRPRRPVADERQAGRRRRAL